MHKRSFSKIELLRGDAGPEARDWARDFFGAGIIPMTDAEEREYRTIFGAFPYEQRVQKRVEQPDERLQLRQELLKRIGRR